MLGKNEKNDGRKIELMKSIGYNRAPIDSYRLRISTNSRRFV